MSEDLMCICGHSFISHGDNGCIHCECSRSVKVMELELENAALRKQLALVVENLSVVLDCIDYMAGNCKLNEPIGGVLPNIVIRNARNALAEIEKGGRNDQT